MKVKPTSKEVEPAESEQLDTGPDSAGQSGDTQGLSTDDEGAYESVKELVEEGQSFEAGVVSGIENAPPADVDEVKTREVPEDDVPLEYVDEDERWPGR